jgi:hypothetical protein
MVVEQLGLRCRVWLGLSRRGLAGGEVALGVWGWGMDRELGDLHRDSCGRFREGRNATEHVGKRRDQAEYS